MAAGHREEDTDPEAQVADPPGNGGEESRQSEAESAQEAADLRDRGSAAGWLAGWREAWQSGTLSSGEGAPVPSSPDCATGPTLLLIQSTGLSQKP